MVREGGITPLGPASRGAVVLCHVVERALEQKESGLYFDELTPTRAKAPAYDADMRACLRRVSLKLTRPFAEPSHA
jgi:hypothetical protein